MKKKTSKSNIHRTNLDKVRQQYQELGGDSRWFKARPGKTIIRILPPWGEAAQGSFFYFGALHYGFSIGGENRAIPCTRLVDKGPCAVCEFVEALKASGDEDHKEIVNKIRPKKKYWINLIEKDYKTKEVKDEKVYMFGAGKKMIDAVMGAMEDPDFGDITDPDEGHDIVLTRTGTGMYDTRYEFILRPKPSPIGTDDWMNNLHQLDQEVMEWMSYKEMVTRIKENFKSTLDEVEISFSVKSDHKKKKKAKPIVEKNDDDEEEDSEEDSEEVLEEDEEDDDD